MFFETIAKNSLTTSGYDYAKEMGGGYSSKFDSHSIKFTQIQLFCHIVYPRPKMTQIFKGCHVS